MKKIIALDIDGTLTNSKKEITKPTLDKIMEIQKKGHVVAIASGRPLPGIRKYEAVPEYFVLYIGSESVWWICAGIQWRTYRELQNR